MLFFNKKTYLIYLSLLLLFSLPSVLSAQELKGGVIGNLKDYSNKKHQSEINNVKYSEKNIDELGFILYDLIQRQDFDKINEIIGNYVDHKDHDKELVKYIHSERAVLNKQYDLAISLYNEILIHKPNMLLVELKLAQALTYVKHYESALSIYQNIKVKYKERISNGLTKFIKSQIIDLENKNRWQGTIKLGSSYDFNLNEASNSREMYCFRSKCMNSSNQSIAGGKWHYYTKLSKRFPLVGNHSAVLSLGVVGVEPMKTVTARKTNIYVTGGYQFDNANTKFYIQPTLEAKWHDNQYYNLSFGGKIAAEYTLSRRVTFLSDIEYKNKTYPYKYSFNNGDKWVYSVTGTYLMNPRLMVFGSFYGANRKKQYDSDSYVQYGVRAGFLKVTELCDLLVAIGYKQTNIEQFDAFLNVKRKDHNGYLNTQLTFDKNKILTFTPSIYFNSQVNKSTADIIYSFKQSEVGVNFTKKF
ncbi:surface lipoprotein assembly modifier [Providencia sp. PROV075]|uniref:surface lipoprotein assembly modifier n=1 Tax=Providencia sp. PROV075 TaxID=2949797 RepID=UPI002349CA88|nr:surface lipoprotein assembly modifier [Providencia sp. PROV075]